MKFDPAITITFMTRETERGFYVQEHVKDAHGYIEYGPMKEAEVEPFIQARLAYYHNLIDEIKKRALVKLGILPGAEPVVQSTMPLGMAEAEAKARGSLDEPPRSTSASKAWHSIDEPEPPKLKGASATMVITDDPFKKCDCPAESCRDLYNCRHG